MNVENFIKRVGLSRFSEIDKIKYLGFYLKKENQQIDFTIKEISEILTNNHFGKPNSSRLTTKLKKDRSFVKGKRHDSFTVNIKTITKLESEITFLNDKSEEIFSSSSILPDSLFDNTRAYLEVLCKQINASYENNIFDGTAVLMRRLMEVLLIEAYKNNSRDNEIKNGKVYKNLNSIINYTKENDVFSLTKETNSCLDSFRKLGNFSAHKIYYNCRKFEIKNVAMEYRVAMEELLYASKIKA